VKELNLDQNRARGSPESSGLRTTSAMAAEVSKRLWEIGDIVNVLEAWKPPLRRQKIMCNSVHFWGREYNSLLNWQLSFAALVAFPAK
jgi:hypothetical protein